MKERKAGNLYIIVSDYFSDDRLIVLVDYSLPFLPIIHLNLKNENRSGGKFINIPCSLIFYVTDGGWWDRILFRCIVSMFCCNEIHFAVLWIRVEPEISMVYDSPNEASFPGICKDTDDFHSFTWAFFAHCKHHVSVKWRHAGLAVYLYAPLAVCRSFSLDVQYMYTPRRTIN